MFSKTTVRLAAASGLFIGLAVGMPLGAAISHADPVTPVFEDEPGWNCVTQGNRVCGPENPEGIPAGCYNDRAELVALWPCHVVVNPATGEGDVYTGAR